MQFSKKQKKGFFLRSTPLNLPPLAHAARGGPPPLATPLQEINHFLLYYLNELNLNAQVQACVGGVRK